MTNEELHAAWPEYIHPNGIWDGNEQLLHADKDGWGVYAGRSAFRTELPQPDGHHDWTLQKRFRINKYSSDEQAAINVWRMAGYGSERCRAALLFLRHHAPVEYENIRKYCMENA